MSNDETERFLADDRRRTNRGAAGPNKQDNQQLERLMKVKRRDTLNEISLKTQ